MPVALPPAEVIALAAGHQQSGECIYMQNNTKYGLLHISAYFLEGAAYFCIFLHILFAYFCIFLTYNCIFMQKESIFLHIIAYFSCIFLHISAYEMHILHIHAYFTCIFLHIFDI